VANDEFCAFTCKLVGNRDALLWITDVVAEDQLDLLAKNAVGFIDIDYGLFATILELGAKGRR